MVIFLSLSLFSDGLIMCVIYLPYSLLQWIFRLYLKGVDERNPLYLETKLRSKVTQETSICGLVQKARICGRVQKARFSSMFKRQVFAAMFKKQEFVVMFKNQVHISGHVQDAIFLWPSSKDTYLFVATFKRQECMDVFKKQVGRYLFFATMFKK